MQWSVKNIEAMHMVKFKNLALCTPCYCALVVQLWIMQAHKASFSLSSLSQFAQGI